MRIKASVRQCYEGKWYSEGAEFDVTDTDGADLIAIGFAARVQAVPAIERAQLHTADLTAETAEPAAAEGAVKPKRAYNRRDMTAER